MKASCFGQDSQGKKIKSLLFGAFAWLRHQLRTYEEAVGDAGVYDAALLKFLFAVADVCGESPVPTCQCSRWLQNHQ